MHLYIHLKEKNATLPNDANTVLLASNKKKS